MTKGEFVKRVGQLGRDVGTGKMEVKVVVNQIYAQNQHENMGFRHTGGGAKFLTRALFGEYRSIMRGFARDVYRPRGLVSAAIAGSERIVNGVRKYAPHEFNDLRNSGAPSVKDRGRFVYDRPPVVKRLSKNQLKAKDRARGRKP